MVESVIQTDRQTGRHSRVDANINRVTQTDKTERQADRQTNRQTNIQTDRQTD